MNNKKLTILIAVIVIILAVILFAVLSNKNIAPNSKSNAPQANTNKATNSVATSETEKVVVPEGVDASTIVPVIPKTLSAMPGSPEAPKQEVIADVNNIPENAVKMTVSDSGFEPKEFTVQAGQKVSLAITSLGGTHVFIFPNASLMALTMMISSEETKVINFVAPAAGSYSFRDDIPSFRNNTGTMIVK